jgi:hypothetical protein
LGPIHNAPQKDDEVTADQWYDKIRQHLSPYSVLRPEHIQAILDDGRVQGMREAANEQDAAEDLSNAAKTLILNMNNLTENLWVNLSNARNRFDTARQHRINNELRSKSHSDKLAKGQK